MPLTVWGIQERARAKADIRTMVYVLGDVGYQSNGNDLTARTRKWEVEDLLGDKNGETHGSWSDWIPVDRYCLKRLKNTMSLLACTKHNLTRPRLGLSWQTLHCPINLCFHPSPPLACDFLKGRHCYIQFSVPSTLVSRQSSYKCLLSIAGNAQKTWPLFLALPQSVSITHTRLNRRFPCYICTPFLFKSVEQE